MPALTVRCPRCGAVLRAPLALPTGTPVRCTACQTVFKVQAPTPAVPTRPATPARREPMPAVEPPRLRRRDARPVASEIGSGRGPGAGLLVGGLVALFVVFAGLATCVVIATWPHAASKPPLVAEAQQTDAQKPIPEEPVAESKEPPRVMQTEPPKAPVAPAHEDQNGGTIPLATLQALKQATVYVKVRAGNMLAFGSGFVVQSRGQEAYLVTNHHVIAPKEEKEEKRGSPSPQRQMQSPGTSPSMRSPFTHRFGPRFGPRFPQPTFPHIPIPRPPVPVGPHFGQPFGRPVLRRPVFRVKPTVHVVFNSGAPGQETLEATVVADDADADLAVLRVRGGRALPAALDLTQQPELAETLPVYMFGFPFGPDLAVTHTEPAISVFTGTISSLRRDKQGELAVVQITGEVHPGNSGGPVVDAHGRLVGITVAKIRKTNIGFAIPAHELSVVLSGRLSSLSVRRVHTENASARLQGQRAEFDGHNRTAETRPVNNTRPTGQLPPGEGGTNGVLVTARLVDPLHKIHSIKVHLAPGDVTGTAQARGSDSWSPIQATLSRALNVSGQSAENWFGLDADGGVMTVQVSYRGANGQTVYTQPWVARMR